VANVKGAVMTLEVHDGADETRVAALTSSSVGEPGGKRVTVRILDLADVKGAVMTLEVHDGADATCVAASTSSSVGEPGGKRVTVRILDVANVKGAVMTLEVHDDGRVDVVVHVAEMFAQVRLVFCPIFVSDSY
jgi:hypothetical protein